MPWLVFSYSLPSTGRSSARVSVWRRLRTLGAVSPKGSVHILPDRDECAEAFQWLVREVEQPVRVGVDGVVQLEGPLDEGALRRVVRVLRLVDEDRTIGKLPAEDV